MRSIRYVALDFSPRRHGWLCARGGRLTCCSAGSGQVYRASVHGFVRLALGLSLLSSERTEVAVTDALGASPVELGQVLDALEGFADLYDERDQARKSMLGLPPPPPPPPPAAAGADEDADLAMTMEDTQVVDETQPGAGGGDEAEAEQGLEVDADRDRTVRMREVVQRLRRRIKPRR